jgi:hypothetical protein
MSRPARRFSGRTLGVALGVAIVVPAGAATAIHRVASARKPAVPAPAAAAELPLQATSSPRRAVWLSPRTATPGPAGSTAGEAPAKLPLRTMAARAARAPWSGRPLDDDARKLVGEVGCSEDDVRLLADERGRVPDAARRDLLAGRDAGRLLAVDLGVAKNREDELVGVVVGYMVRRVALRESFRGTAVTPEAIDEAVRTDALNAAGTFDEHVQTKVAAALPGLPDLTADLPRAR